MTGKIYFLKLVSVPNQLSKLIIINYFNSFHYFIKFSKRAMIVECSYTKTAEIVPYYKYKNKKMAHFPFNFQFVGINKKLGNELTSKSLKSSIEDYLAVLPNDCWANWQVCYHRSFFSHLKVIIITSIGCTLKLF